jgi:hypothetical protein
MLENRTLLLRPWAAAGDHHADCRPARAARAAAVWTRAILAAETGERLGHARWRPSRLPGWLYWFARPVLEVYETEDAALLCTAHQLWGLNPSWRVRDAEGNPVGTIWALDSQFSGCLLADQWGHCFARIQPSPNGTLGEFIAPAGHAVGTLQRGPEGNLLTFAPMLDANPFAKMIVLAAGLQF